MENTRRHDGICRRSSRSRRTLILCWATMSEAESMKRSVEIMKTRSKATLTLRAMLARRYGFGASPNKPPLCHLWPQRHCLPLSGSPQNSMKKRRLLLLNLRFSGFFQRQPEPMKVKPSLILVHSHITLYHCTFRVEL